MLQRLSAALVKFKSKLAGAVERSLDSKMGDYVSLKDFGAKGDGVSDDTAALQAMVTLSSSGTTVQVPSGTYMTSQPLNFKRPVRIVGEPGARIKLSGGNHPYVIQMDFRGPDGDYWAYGAHMSNIVADGGGFAVDGFSLRGVISSDFPNLRATNVTRAGLHLWWTQLNLYTNFQCSKGVEAFDTVPNVGILIDCEFGTGNDRGTSADTFINTQCEHVTGAGVLGRFANNCVFINGTSEGNAIGLEFGHPTDTRYQAVSNTVTGMDLEVNSSTDILLHPNTYSNTFNGVMSGYGSPSIQVAGSHSNVWIGGTCAGIDFSAASHDNKVYGTSLLGADSVIVDAGLRNKWVDVFNISTGQPHTSTDPYPSRSNQPVGADETVTIDCLRASSVVCTATGSIVNIASAARKIDGARVDLTIHNASGNDSLVVNWSSDFRVGGWTSPAAGRHIGMTLVYDANYGYWKVVGMGREALSV